MRRIGMTVGEANACPFSTVIPAKIGTHASFHGHDRRELVRRLPRRYT